MSAVIIKILVTFADLSLAMTVDRFCKAVVQEKPMAAVAR